MTSLMVRYHDFRYCRIGVEIRRAYGLLDVMAVTSVLRSLLVKGGGLQYRGVNFMLEA